MHQHTAEVMWERGGQPFLDRRYSRRHLLKFDGGAEVVASSSPSSVRIPLSDPTGVDPEEGLIASVASCHMLWFLDLAARAGFRVDGYHDNALGVLNKNDGGKYWMSAITLRPVVRFSGDPLPSRDQILHLHHQAHEECYIANSVKSEVRCEPVF